MVFCIMFTMDMGTSIMFLHDKHDQPAPCTDAFALNKSNNATREEKGERRGRENGGE